MKKTLISVLITTLHRGVWFAQVEEGQDLTAKTITNLKNTKMAIYWGTNNGLQQLCKTGPTSESRISDESEILVLHDVTAVFAVTDKAAGAYTATVNQALKLFPGEASRILAAAELNGYGYGYGNGYGKGGLI